VFSFLFNVDAGDGFSEAEGSEVIVSGKPAQ
jgi:hypothetical protein